MVGGVGPGSSRVGRPAANAPWEFVGGRRKGAPGAALSRSRCWYNKSSAVVMNRIEQRARWETQLTPSRRDSAAFVGFRQGLVSLGSPAAVRGGSGDVHFE